MEGEGEDHQNKSKVVKVDSKDSWDFSVTQATIQGCPVSIYSYKWLIELPQERFSFPFISPSSINPKY